MKMKATRERERKRKNEKQIDSNDKFPFEFMRSNRKILRNLHASLGFCASKMRIQQWKWWCRRGWWRWWWRPILFKVSPRVFISIRKSSYFGWNYHEQPNKNTNQTAKRNKNKIEKKYTKNISIETNASWSTNKHQIYNAHTNHSKLYTFQQQQQNMRQISNFNKLPISQTVFLLLSFFSIDFLYFYFTIIAKYQNIIMIEC